MQVMIRPDDLLVLLEVARLGSFAAAGAVLGVDHTTVSRRISSLERELGQPVVVRGAAGCTITDQGRELLDAAERIERAMSTVSQLSATPTGRPGGLHGLVRITAPEGFGSMFVAPAAARLQREHPGVRVEQVITTRPLVQGVGSDIEIGVGRPASSRLKSLALTRYSLGLYASAEYLAAAGTPGSVDDLSRHPLAYYVDSLLRVDDLDLLHRLFRSATAQFASTSVHAQLQATAAGGGVGLLPHFLARTLPELRRVLPADVDVVLHYRVALAPAVLRRPAAVALLEAIRAEVAGRRQELLPAI